MPRAADWAGETGCKWAALSEAMERQLAPVAAEGVAALAPSRGERVIEIGCGAGATSRAIAEAVGPDGRISAVDISPDLAARARARLADLAQATVIEADAARHPFARAGHDALFSQVGCMFFDDPPAAFANLAGALAPGGRAVFAVFAEPAANPWATLALRAAEAVLGPAPAGGDGTPGPFAWSDPETVAPILAGAGFRDVAWQARDLCLAVGAGDAPDPVDRAVALMTRIGPAAARLRTAPAGAADAVAVRLARDLAPHVEGDAVRLPARIRLISARV